MKQLTGKYGESAKTRKANGAKLKQARLALGLTAREASERMRLKNSSAVVNAEMGCSTDMMQERMKLYQRLEQKKQNDDPARPQERAVIAQDVKAKTPESSLKEPSSDKPARERNVSVGSKKRVTQPEKIAQLPNRPETKLLAAAVRRLAIIENKTETEIWISLLDELAGAQTKQAG